MLGQKRKECCSVPCRPLCRRGAASSENARLSIYTYQMDRRQEDAYLTWLPIEVLTILSLWLPHEGFSIRAEKHARNEHRRGSPRNIKSLYESGTHLSSMSPRLTMKAPGRGATSCQGPSGSGRT